MKKIIALLLVVISCFSVMLTACNNTQGPDGSTTGTIRKRYQGTHIFNISESATDYIVENGSTKYTILLPATATRYTSLATTELQTFFKEATGIQLSVEKEVGEGLKHSKDQTYISIGNTGLLKSTGLTADKTVLKSEGYRIKTIDKNIYLFTAYDVGNLYAVYELMEILFNYQYYYYDCYEIETGVTSEKLPILDVTDVPDFNIRINTTQSIQKAAEDKNAANRMRFSQNNYLMAVGDIENGIYPKNFHNSGAILPVKDNAGQPIKDDESKWHATGGGNQLCYTAHGDAESYERMYKKAAKVITDCLSLYPTEQYPDYRLATITCEDERSFCECEWCAQEEAKYGAKSAAVIKFMNHVAEEIEIWMEDPANAAYKREDFNIIFFAYFAYLQAPVHYDETLGKYVLNEDLYMRDDIGIFYAINDVTSTVSVYDEANSSMKYNSEAWFDVSPITYIWTYSGNTSFGPSMWPSYEHLDEDGYNFFACGETFMFQDYRDYEDLNNTGFQSLKLYIDSQMLWDCSQSIADIKDRWFKAMFGEVGDIMRELFERELLYTTNVYDEYHNAREQHGWGINFNPQNWSMSEMETWIRLCQKAHEKAAEIYKGKDDKKYKMICHHIDQEFFFPAFVIILSNSKDTGGQLYVDVVKYLQANAETFKGYRVSSLTDYADSVWMDIVV